LNCIRKTDIHGRETADEQLSGQVQKADSPNQNREREVQFSGTDRERRRYVRKTKYVKPRVLGSSAVHPC
jgi:hypothetical protein